MKLHRTESIWNQTGSFTIEIALLMPFIIGVFLFILFMAYYVHDRCVLEKTCLTSALRGSQELEKKAAYVSAEAVMQELYLNRLIGDWELNHKIEITEEKVMSSVQGTMHVTEGLLRILIGGVFSFDTEVEAERISEPRFIRLHKSQE